MSDWTSGYVADIDYTFGYYPELNPLRCQLAAIPSGINFPHIKTACELGFGQGLSTNFHAAASNVEWWGTDFNPAQAGFAQELARISGSNVHLFDESFVEFCSREDLPEFDFISLHGIWSWISSENREIIVDFIRRKLNVGGVLYISYNTLPGWSSFAPIRHIMTRYAESMSNSGEGIIKKIDGSIEFAEKLLSTKPAFQIANPTADIKLKDLIDKDRHYLAHEYFNKDWHPMYFADVADMLESAKIDFACSAYLPDFLGSINLNKEQQDIIKSIPDPILRQSTRDIFTNAQFRRDYWIKGPRKYTQIEQLEALSSQKVVLSRPMEDVNLKVTTSLGEIKMSREIYDPILNVLSDYKAKSIADIQSELAKDTGKFNFATILEAIMILTSNGDTMPVQDVETCEIVSEKVEKINDFLMKKARGTAGMNHLASPLTGGGVPVSRFHQLFILALKSGANSPGDMARTAWQYLSHQGEKLIVDGKALNSDEENIKELESQANKFKSKHLNVLKGLMVV